MEDYAVNVLIVLYNSKLSQSKTLQTLDKLSSLKNINVIIWNNGPEDLKPEFDKSSLITSLKSLFYYVRLEQTLCNKPLSHIYNEFTDKDLLILDHDTELTESYSLSVKEFMLSKQQLLVPKIIQGGLVCYPKQKGKVLESQVTGYMDFNKVISITSGLVVKKCLLKELADTFGAVFDPRFALYGIDTTFFIRCKNLGLEEFYLGGDLLHDLSSNSEAVISDARLKERGIDTFLQLRCYPSLGGVKGGVQFLLASPKARTLKLLPLFIRAFVLGKHPRCNLVKK